VTRVEEFVDELVAARRLVRLGVGKARRRGRAYRREVRDSANRRGRSYAVNLLTPILPGHEQLLIRTLEELPRGSESPLADLRYLHFARWVVVDRLKTDWEGAPSVLPCLKSQYLLFTADVTAPEKGYRLPGDFLRDLADQPVAEQVWGHCRGYPGHDRLHEYLAASRVDASLYFAAYPDATAPEIRHALSVRQALIDFAREHQTASPQQLKQAYFEASKEWFPST
jgi:hypothetical protein